MMNRFPSFNHSLLASFLLLGCFSCTQPATDSSGEKKTQDDHMVETKNEAPKGMEKADLTGKWVYDEAPDEPMNLQRSGDNLKLEWIAVIDRDIELKGELSPNDKGGFAGTLSYYIGDEKGKAPATVQAGAGPDQMDFTFDVLFEGPVPFTRQKPLTCEEAAIKVLERSNSYQQLVADNEVEGIMAEKADNGSGFDLQVYALSESDEVLTLGRYMVDVKSQQLQQFNVVEGEYASLDEGGLFDGIDCK